MGLIIHVDGGARGNPGPAGAGVVIQTDGGQTIHEAGYFLGRQTNNAAEYHALIRALQRAQRCPAQPIIVHSDSELLVRQITGEYQVKSPTLAHLYEQVQSLLLKVSAWSVRHVRRGENRRADELANLAMDRQGDVVVFDADGEPGQTAPPAAQPGSPRPAESALGPDAPAAAKTPLPAPEPVIECAALAPGRQAIRVTVARQPGAGSCPAGGLTPLVFTIESTLPSGLCIHAAHALLPTLLAMLNTDAQEFAAVPTLTVRCSRPGCDAVFQLSPVRGANGTGRRAKRGPPPAD